VAFGVLHISKSEYLKMTPYEVILAYEGFSEHRGKELEQFWYMTRRLEYRAYLSTDIGKKKHISIEKYWPDWNEEAKKVNIPSKAERMRRYEKLMKKNGKGNK